jgi:hypothetical protein
MAASERPHIDKEKLKKQFDISHFDINAVLRGVQLTLVGGTPGLEDLPLPLPSYSPPRLGTDDQALAHRALQNPEIFTSQHYRQAAIAVGAGIAIRLAIAVPVSTAHPPPGAPTIAPQAKLSCALVLTLEQILGIRVLIWFLSFIFRLDAVSWDDTIINGLTFIEEHVLQVPLFLMTLMRYVTPTLDAMCVPDTPEPILIRLA